VDTLKIKTTTLCINLIIDDVPVVQKNSHTHSPLLLDHIRYELIAKLATTSEETPVGFLLTRREPTVLFSKGEIERCGRKKRGNVKACVDES
jgi:hypothetical protein